MKKIFPLVTALFMLIMAALACRLPWQGETTPDAELETSMQEVPTASVTMSPIEITTSTATVTPSFTPTEEISVSLPAFPNPVIIDISMFTTLEGWSVTQDGNQLLRTIDGGKTWLDATPTELHPLPEGFTSLGIDPFTLDENTAWFTPNSVSGGILYHTQDGGISWSKNTIPFDRARYFFLNITDGYALEDLGAAAGSHYVALYRTDDGGLTWTEVFSHESGESKSLPESGSKSGITFLDVNHGWVGGTIPMTDYFYLHFTTNGGVSWTQETDISLPGAYAGSFLEVRQPQFMTNISGYLPVRALTSDGDSYLLVYRSDDSGQTWTFQNSAQDGRAIDFHTLDEGWLAASTNLLQTTDGGSSWSPVPITIGPVGEFILGVDFVDDQHGWLIATPDDETWNPLKLYRTTDGGINWTQLVP